MSNYTPAPGSAIMVYNESFELCAVFNDAYELIFKDQVITRTKGYETLSFKVTLSDEYYTELQSERLVQFDTRWFRIKIIDESRYADGIVSVECYALWYCMKEGNEISFKASDTTLAVILGRIGTAVRASNEITIVYGDLGNRVVQGFTSEVNSPLYHYRKVLKQYGLDTRFRYTKLDTGVRIVAEVIEDPADRVEWPLAVGRTLSNVKRTVDSSNLCTRFTLIGSDDLGNEITIESINNGLRYLEDYYWFDKVGAPRRIIPATRQDQRFSNKGEMRDYMRRYLRVYRSPLITFSVSAILYASDGIPELMNQQLVIDTEYNLTEWRTLSQRQINYSSLESSELVFNDPRQTIIDTLNSEDDL